MARQNKDKAGHALPSVARSVKNLWRQRSAGLSLKQWARTSDDPLVKQWLTGKVLNLSAPSQKIGRTNRVSKKAGGK